MVGLELSLCLRGACRRAMLWVDEREGHLLSDSLEAEEEAPACGATEDIGGDAAVKANQVAVGIVNVFDNFDAAERLGRRARLSRVD